MPRLLSLHHVHVLHRVIVTPGRPLGSCRLLPVFAPNIRLADVVIVRNRDHRPVPENLPELQSELKPACRMFGVVVGLVTREEQQVGILLPQVLDDPRARTTGSRGVTRQIAHDNHILLNRIMSNQALKFAPVTVPHAISDVS